MQTRKRIAAMTATITVGACAAGGVSAQDQPQNLQEIVVTGSRIRNSNINVETPTPVTTLSAEELASTGSTSLGDALGDLPALRSTFSTANSSRFIGTAGVNFLDLRGLGSQRTLVLVNGRRHVSSTDGSEQVDVNSIPSDLLERVDVITGGDSSIYGSDAVAGVVNFVLKDNFEGMKLNVQSGTSAYSDNGNSSVSFTAGRNFLDNRANLAASVEYSRENALKFSERTFLRQRQGFVQTNVDATGNSDGIPDTMFFNDLRSINISEGGTFIPRFQNGGGAGIANVNRPQNGQPRAFTFNPDGTLTELNYGDRDFRPLSANLQGGSGSTLRAYGFAIPEIVRKSFSTVGHLDLNDKLTVFGEGKFVRASTLSLTSPSFNQRTSAAPQSPGFASAVPIRLDNPFLSAQARAMITSFLPAGATGFSLNRNNADLGVRGEDTDRDTTRIVGGIKGELTDHLSYEVSLNYGQTEIDTDVLGNRLEDNFLLAADAARASDGSIVCRSRLNSAGVVTVKNDPLIDNCVPINLFGAGNVSPEARNYINSPSTFHAKVTQRVANGFVSYDTGAFFELPGGPIGTAFGLEYRSETSDARYSDDVSSGITFLNAIQPLDKGFNVKEAFAEVRLPVFKDLPALEELTLSGSIRESDYNLKNTSNIEAWNGSLQWAPIKDIAFRASLSKSVRTPTISDLFNPLTQNFANVTDPCDAQFINQGTATRAANCRAAGVPVGFTNTVARSQTIEIRSGGNSGLTEEQSRSVTIGTIIQPRFVPGLAITVDYYQIQVQKLIASVSAQQILNSCYDAASLNNMFCPLVFRDPATSLFFQQGNGPIGGGVLQSTLNYAAQRTRGVDSEISYSFNWEDVGRFNARFLGTYVRQLDNYLFLNDPTRPDQQLEELGDPKYSFNFSLGFNRGPLGIDYKMRWIESQSSVAIENLRRVGGRPPANPDIADRPFTGSVMYHDVRADYRMTDNLKLYAGVDNLTNRKPPLGLTGTGGGSGIYQVPGQFIYGGLNWSFGGGK